MKNMNQIMTNHIYESPATMNVDWEPYFTVCENANPTIISLIRSLMTMTSSSDISIS